MSTLRKPSWDDFNSIYTGQQREAFECLCRNLFRARFGLPESLGYFRNNAGNETDIIEHEGEYYGFNAKYFEGEISASDICDSMQKAHNNNLGQNVFIIYTNKAFGNPPQGRHKTQKQQKIEDKANELGLRIEWMLPDNIIDAVMKNELLYHFFFEIDSNYRTIDKDVQQNNELYLEKISNSIKLYDGREITIDRESDIQWIEMSLQGTSIAVLAGESGVGKSALLKDLYQKIAHDDTHITYIIDGYQLCGNEIDYLFSLRNQHTFSSFLKRYKDYEEKIFIIDSVEKAYDLGSNRLIDTLIDSLLQERWGIVISVKENSYEELSSALGEIRCDVRRISPLPEEELTTFCINNSISIPQDNRLKTLLRIPFYLARYVEVPQNANGVYDVTSFKETVWRSKVAGSHNGKEMGDRRTECTLNIAKLITEKKSFEVPIVGLDKEALAGLESDGVIGRNIDTTCHFIHDIYFDWAMDKLVETECATSDFSTFVKSSQESTAKMFAFMRFADKCISEGKTQWINIITRALSNGTFNGEWQRNVWSVFLKNENARNHIVNHKNAILAEDGKLLTFLLKTLISNCQKIYNYFTYNGKSYPLTRPYGEGWNVVIEILAEIGDNYYISHLNLITYVLEAYLHYEDKRATAKPQAGILALKYFDIERDYRAKNQIILFDEEKKFCQIVCQYTGYIQERLKKILKDIVANNWRKRHDPYFDLLEYVTTTDDVTTKLYLSYFVPAEFISILNFYWREHLDDDNEDFYTSARRNYYEPEYYYGIYEYLNMTFFPCSGLQTPITALLSVRPIETLDFVIGFLNESVSIYKQRNNREYVKEVFFEISPTEKKDIVCSSSLWNMYRGSSNVVVPHLLESMLMATDNFLYELCKNKDFDKVKEYIREIFSKTNNCSLMAIVAGLVVEFPDDLFDEALLLMQNAEFLMLDQTRKINESTALGIDFMYHRHKRMYEERKASKERSCRLKDLENLCMTYQIGWKDSTDISCRQKLEKVYDVVDKLRQQKERMSEEELQANSFYYMFARLDVRNMKEETVTLKNGITAVQFTPYLDDAHKEETQQRLNETNNFLKYISLRTWADFEYKENKEKLQSYEYSKNPIAAYELAIELYDKVQGGNELILIGDEYVPAIVSAILLLKHKDSLEESQVVRCKQILKQYLKNPAAMSESLSGLNICLSALLLWIRDSEDNEEKKALRDVTLLYLTTSRSYMNTRYCDLIQNIIEKYHIYDAIPDFIDSLISEVMSKRNTEMSDETTSDILLCLIPYLTKDSIYTDDAVNCMRGLATLWQNAKGGKRMIHEPYHDQSENIARFIVNSDAKYIKKLISPFKDALDNNTMSENLLSMILLQSVIYSKPIQLRECWRQLADSVVSCAQKISFTELLNPYFFHPRWLYNNTENWFPFEQEDLDNLSSVFSRITITDRTIYLLLVIADTIGEKQAMPILHLISDIPAKGLNVSMLNHQKDIVFLAENVTRNIIENHTVNEIDNYDYKCLESILKSLIKLGSNKASLLLAQIKR